MKSNTIFLCKIWIFALLSSTFLIFISEFSSKNFKSTINQLFIGCTFLLPFLFLFIRFGSAILINSKIDTELNHKKELFKLAIFISVNIWLVNYFFFTFFGNLEKNHFFSLPFFLAMIFGIYFFKIRKEQEFFDENILDENFNFKK